MCNWIKGLYSVAIRDRSIDEIISVVSGDCSNTHALTELYEENNITVHRFSYPSSKSNLYNELKTEITNLAAAFSLTLKDVQEYSKITDIVRTKLKKIDQLTIENKVTGFENHLWLVSSTDFCSDLDKFSKNLDEFIKVAEDRKPINSNIRLAFIGVPPIIPNIYNLIEKKSCKVVFNEVQRQFSIPSNAEDYVQRYIDYTYPYSIWDRIKDIKEQIDLRKVDGIIHYVQSFCYRQIQDIVIRKHINNIPILTIEGDKPLDIDNRTIIRIDSFIEMLHDKKAGKVR